MVGNSRKNELRALFSGSVTPAATEGEAKPAETATPARAAPAPQQRAASGAVRAMGLSLGTMTREAEEARALRQALNEGERVLSIEPDRIDASFIEDRINLEGRDDPDFEALVESIRESGQQVPVLLRPHPERSGYYQTAYGHRRIRAAARLAQPVRAIVRPLTDDELVLAQGKENAERRNLSFIERALFAQNLVARGFDRKIAGDALAVQKSELSRLLQVAENIPADLVRAIGAAPKAGRDRWMKLAGMLEGAEANAAALAETAGAAFLASDSDRRFQLVFDRLAGRPQPPSPETLQDRQGKVFARIRKDAKSPRIEFSSDIDPAFFDEAVELLRKGYEAFVEGRNRGDGGESSPKIRSVFGEE